MSERGSGNSGLREWSPRELFGSFVDAKRWGTAAGGIRGGLALVAICLAVYLPGFFTIPAVDRDESRFAQASRQMAESTKFEDWIVPRVQDKPRLNKPPLIYWLQAGSVKAGEAIGIKQASDLIWLYRLPSLVAAFMVVLVTWRMGCAMFDPRAGWLAALLVAVCPIVVWESKQARSDMVLLAATTMAQWALFRMWHVDQISNQARKALGHWRLVFWSAMIVGVMVKGPITPMISGLTYASLWLCKRDRGVGKRVWIFLGSLAVLCAIGTWAALVMREVGAQQYLDIVKDETIGRSLEAKESHSGIPGYHLVLFSALFWPGSLVTALALARAWRQGIGPTESRGDPHAPREGTIFQRAIGAVKRRINHGAKGRQAEVFLLAWFILPWLVFELVSTKLPHYVLPIYPALALISARAVFTASCGVMDSVPKLFSRIGYVGWAVIGGVLSVLPLVVWNFFGVDATYAEFGIALLPVALMVITIVIAWKGIFRGIRGGKNQGKFLRAQTVSAAGAGLTWAILCGMVLPSTQSLWISRQLRGVIARTDPAATRPVAAVKANLDAERKRADRQSFQEDSLVFELHGRSERIDEADLESWLKRHPDGLFILPKSLADTRKGVTRLGEASGFNYSNGNWVYLTVCQLPRSADQSRREPGVSQGGTTATVPEQSPDQPLEQPRGLPRDQGVR